MADRKKIGFLFAYNENWIAGSYYIINLINALDSLDDQEKPQIVILSNEESKPNVTYPYLKVLPLTIRNNYFGRFINKVVRTAFGKNLINKAYADKDFDVLFPYRHFPSLRNVKNRLHWIPDFQERYFSDFFPPENVAGRTRYYNELAFSGAHIVFSSENVRKDFYKFYPGSNCKTYILNFACTHPDYNALDLNALKQKYNIDREYFICPNQFWQHKNHMVVLKAIALFKKKAMPITVVFTGKEYDYRNAGYFKNLMEFVDRNNLQAEVKFLGFIPRKDQLKLMSSALAVIQPSLFEGWSTVVEDVKAMNQYIVLSDIEVHKEQLDYNVSFFNPHDENDLAMKMTEVLNGHVIKTSRDYQTAIRKFGSGFVSILNDLVD